MIYRASRQSETHQHKHASVHVSGGAEIDFLSSGDIFFIKNVWSKLAVINALVIFSLRFEILINMNYSENCKADVINIQIKFYVFVKVVGGACLCIQLYIESFMCI